MRTIKRAVLHNTLLLGGANLQMNLDIARRTGLKMIYDEKEELLYVYNNGEFVDIPRESVAQMFREDPSALVSVFEETFNMVINYAKKAAVVVVNKVKGKLSPQASSPMDHVFAGPGAGKTNDRQ